MYNFTYHRASGLRQAQNLMGKLEDPKLLAGGMTLLPTMKLRLASPANIVDLDRVEGLSNIELKGRSLVIGALARHADVAASATVQQAIPALAAVAHMIGDPAVRHRGTLGGSVANNDPNADYPAACLGLGATIITTKRKIVADEFFKGLFETALEPDEIITKVSFPLAKKAAYQKFRNPARGEAPLGDPRGGDGRRCVRRVPREVVRGGAQETLLPEIAGGTLRAGDRHGERHPRRRRVSRPPDRRARAPRGRGGGVICGTTQTRLRRRRHEPAAQA